MSAIKVPVIRSWHDVCSSPAVPRTGKPAPLKVGRVLPGTRRWQEEGEQEEWREKSVVSRAEEEVRPGSRLGGVRQRREDSDEVNMEARDAPGIQPQ